jgi:ABC-type spermidine/putrescine transport system permease subunit I
MLFLSIHIAFTLYGTFTKGLVLISALILTVWISTLQTVLLLILALPVLLTLSRANNEYRERYYL